MQPKNHFTLEERFKYGNFTIPEVCELKNKCPSGFYQDVRKGLVEIEKQGARSIIRGPVAKRYITGSSSEPSSP